MNELAKIDSYRTEVALAETVDEVKLLTTKGELLAQMAKKLKIPLAGQNQLGRTRVGLEKKKRELIVKMFPKGKRKGEKRINSRDTSLLDSGITFDESSDAKIIKDEEELVEEVMNEIENSTDVITPQKVASKIRKKKKAEKKKEKKKISEAVDKVVNANSSPVKIENGWHKIGNQFLYCGSNLDSEFTDNLPKCKFAFTDPPYNAGVAEWDSNFKWEQDYLQDIADVVSVTPGGWNAFEFYNATKMNYVWEMVCWIKNGMTHGRCGFANFIKASIFSKHQVKIPQDFWEITIKTSETEETNHKGRKPYDFMIHLIDMFSRENDNIIDPFAGSGTTLLVSEKMNRISYNAEKDKLFCVDIIKRASQLGMKYERI